jgi:hypothetical protein
MEQQRAPAIAKREYRARPVGAVGSTWAASWALAASTLLEPVAVGGGAVDIVAVMGDGQRRIERRGGDGG